MLINGGALLYTCISRPYRETLVNVHTIINDVGVIVVICEFFPMLQLYVTDHEFYLYGKIVIGTIATIIFINFCLFCISFVLSFYKFMLGCPHCTCGLCKKKRDKEKLIIDPNRDLNLSKESLIEPTPPKEPTPLPTPDPTPTPEEKIPTPPRISTLEPEESDDDMELQAATVLVKD